MKKISVILLVLIAFSCSNEEITQYNISLDEWKTLKKQYDNSYTYTTSFESWAGFGTNTTLTIQNGIVVSRAYEGYQRDNTNGNIIITETYIETIEHLNTHERGFPTLTVDELYTSCIEDYLSVNKKNNTIYFETNDIGIISICGFVPDGCIDDCFRGFRISSFEWKSTLSKS